MSERLAEIALELRRDGMAAALAVGKGHVPPALSWADIAAFLYFGGGLTLDPSDPKSPSRDRFILSKGHGCLTLYAALVKLGWIPAEEMGRIGKPGALLPGHPDPSIPGVDAVSGSLGHGLGVAAGQALAARLKGSGSRAVVLSGDGELQEGSMWEAVMYAAHAKLANLVLIIDRNRLSATGFTEDIVALEPLDDRFRSFGWRVERIDGHDFGAISGAWGRLPDPASVGAPTVVIADTVKGRGVPFMENSPAWHHKMPSGDQIGEAKRLLGISA